MPNVASALKQEIARVARREIRAETNTLRKGSAAARSRIAELQRRLQALERRIKGLERAKGAGSATVREEAPALRFRPDGLKKHRMRLGLSANDVAKILGCSQLSVYKWESGKTRPRAAQLNAIAQLRTMGKREALKRLEEISGGA